MNRFPVKLGLGAATATVVASLALSPAVGLGQSQAASVARAAPIAGVGSIGSEKLAHSIAETGDEVVVRADRVELPSDGFPTLQVRDGRQVELRKSPGGSVAATLSDTTEFGSPTVLSVVKRKGNWAGVPTQMRDNGDLAWVKLDEKDLKIDSVSREIRVDLSDYSAKLIKDGSVERTWQIGIGGADTPTPTGRFSITDELTSGLNPAYGCCVLALSATQPNLPAGWSGGNRMAIHGTSEPLGEANSTGCVHSGEADLQALLDKAPLGTPVTIQD
jgi:hypothetical protein